MGKQVCKSLILSWNTRNDSKLFWQGLWSHLLHQLILVGAAAYWQLSHLLPADVRDALPDMMSFRMCMLSGALMLDLQLQPSTAEHHLAHPGQAHRGCCELWNSRHILSQSQSHKSDMAAKSVAKNDDVCVYSIWNSRTPKGQTTFRRDPPCEFVRFGISLSQQPQRVDSGPF